MSGSSELRIYGPALEMVTLYCRHRLPEEACGVMWSSGRASDLLDSWTWIQNISDEPRVRFRLDPRVQLRVWQDLEDRGIWPALVWRSHPVGPAQPSSDDLAGITDPPLHLILGRFETEAPEARLWTRDEQTGGPVSVPFSVVGWEHVNRWRREPEEAAEQAGDTGNRSS